MTQPRADLSLQATREGIVLWIHVTPRARAERVGGRHGDALRVAVREPPVEGRANAACAKALARALGVTAGAVEIDPGSRGRRKHVRVAGDPEVLREILNRLAAGPARDSRRP